MAQSRDHIRDHIRDQSFLTGLDEVYFSLDAGLHKLIGGGGGGGGRVALCDSILVMLLSSACASYSYWCLGRQFPV